MTVLLVTYDLNSPGQDYGGLYEQLRRWTRCHPLESTWLLDTTDSAATVRDKLKAHLDKGDQLYVFRLRKTWAAYKTDQGTRWLRADARTWD